MADNGSTRDSEGGIDLLDRPDEKVKLPALYTVFVHNDPYTPREFVVEVLIRLFQKTKDQATNIMIQAHTKGMGAVNTYTKEIAEAKANQANTYARSEGRPLHFSIQEQ